MNFQPEDALQLFSEQLGWVQLIKQALVEQYFLLYYQMLPHLGHHFSFGNVCHLRLHSFIPLVGNIGYESIKRSVMVAAWKVLVI